LIVLGDLPSIAEWDVIKPIFHWMKNTSRIIMAEQNIANHCLGKDGIESGKSRSNDLKHVKEQELQ